MPVKEDGELHARQARSAVWDLVLEGREGYRRIALGKIEQGFKGFTVQTY